MPDPCGTCGSPASDGHGPADCAASLRLQLDAARTEASALRKSLSEANASAMWCDRHKPRPGSRASCLECSVETLSRALSAISYECGAPNDMRLSDYDVSHNEEAVVEAVRRMRGTACLCTFGPDGRQCEQCARTSKAMSENRRDAAATALLEAADWLEREGRLWTDDRVVRERCFLHSGALRVLAANARGHE